MGNEVGAPKKQAEKDDAANLKRLKRLGFDSLASCLLSVPKDYLDFTVASKMVTPSMLGTKGYFALRVLEIGAWNRYKERCALGPWAKRLSLTTQDVSGRIIDITVFNNLWPSGEASGPAWRDVNTGDVVHVYGEVGEFRDQLQITNPRLVGQDEQGRICALYPGKQGQIKSETIKEKVEQAQGLFVTAARILHEKAVLDEGEFPVQYGFANARELLESLHRPGSMGSAEKAREAARKLAADAMVRKAMAARLRPPEASSVINVSDEALHAAISALPFKLTGDQARTIGEVVSDLRSPYPMRRLISGDVGTGKSAAFIVPAVAAYRAGASVGILAPSLLVVEQLARELREIYSHVPVVEVTKGGKLGEGIQIGTTALLNAAKKAGKAFDFVITDEQHKFSVGQKASVVGPGTNVLEATATAIPRTLALTQFGGMDQSILKQIPVSKVLRTHIVSLADQDEKRRLDDYFYAALERNLQVAVIYPQVAGAKEGDTWDHITPDDEGYKTVQAAAARWEKVFPGKVGCLHGKMTGEEKTAVIRDMHANKFQILISSVVIEVGVTLPSLKAMMIVNPERYGLSQIHQLRGRLARKGGNGRLFLVLDDHLDRVRQEKPELMERLQILVDCQDGFELAERDMEMRGFGDVTTSAKNQSGSTRGLFWGVEINSADLKDAGLRLGVQV